MSHVYIYTYIHIYIHIYIYTYIYIYMIWAGQHVGQAPKLSTDADVILSILLPATTQESQEY